MDRARWLVLAGLAVATELRRKCCQTAEVAQAGCFQRGHCLAGRVESNRKDQSLAVQVLRQTVRRFAAVAQVAKHQRVRFLAVHLVSAVCCRTSRQSIEPGGLLRQRGHSHRPSRSDSRCYQRGRCSEAVRSVLMLRRQIDRLAGSASVWMLLVSRSWLAWGFEDSWSRRGRASVSGE